MKDPAHDAVLADLVALVKAVDGEAKARREGIDAALAKHRASAINLAHYIGLRARDVRKLQLSLAALGLSSLGRCEGHVRDTLERLCAWLSREKLPEAAAERLDHGRAAALLHENTRSLFGPRPKDRHVYIMVTAPAAEAATTAWADELLQSGTDLLRINGAHETPAEWEQICAVFKERAAALGRPGRVLVDLPGPKLRGEIRQLEEAVIHLPRRKDRMGRSVEPTRLLLVAEHSAHAIGPPQVPVPPAWLAQMKSGDEVVFLDAAGRERALAVRGRAEGGIAAQCDRSLYVASGLRLSWRRGEKVLGEGRVGPLPKQPRELLLSPGDRLLVNSTGLSPDPSMPVLALPEPALLAQVRAGERVVLDDGRIAAVVDEALGDSLECTVQRTHRAPARLRSGKGLAFPDSALSRGELGAQDEAALGFALAHADLVGASFIAAAADVALVSGRLRAAQRRGIGLVLKLETRGAMDHLPEILFEALKYDPVGLMIARGDLAVELSFERLAEMQEELLWFGEACHLPVIWATQVLDSAAHSGVPTRAEVTDAAMAARAECVMLNRGPYVGTAVRMLADIIRKMETHQYKKRSIYRPLHVATPAASN